MENDSILGAFFDQKDDQKIDAEIDAEKGVILMKNRCKNGVRFWYFSKFAFVKKRFSEKMNVLKPYVLRSRMRVREGSPKKEEIGKIWISVKK